MTKEEEYNIEGFLNSKEDTKQVTALKDKFITEEDSILADLDFIKLLHVFRKNYLLILLLLFVGLFCSWVFNRYTKPIYQSSSIIKLDIKNDNKLIGLSSSQESELNNLSSEIELIRSNLIYTKVIEKLNFDYSIYYEGKILSEERYKNSPFQFHNHEIKNSSIYNKKIHVLFLNDKEIEIQYSLNNQDYNYIAKFGEKFIGEHFEFDLEFIDELKKVSGYGKYYFKFNDLAENLNFLVKNLSVQILNSSAKTILISFSCESANKAYDIVNAIDSIYLVESLNKKYLAQEKQLQFLESQLDKTELKLEGFEQSLENFTIENKTYDARSNFEQIIEDIKTIAIENAVFQRHIAELDNLKNDLSNNNEIKELTPIIQELEQKNISNLLSEYNENLSELSALSLSVKDETSVYKIKKEAVKKAKVNLKNAINQPKNSISEKVNLNRKDMLEKQSFFKSLPSKQTELTRMTRFYNLYEGLYLMLINKKAEFEMAKAGMVPEFLILSYPTHNFVPIYPVKLTVYMTGALLGLIVSIFMVLIKYFLHNTINNIGELEKLTPASILGFVPNYDKEKLPISRLVIDKNPKSPLTESLRTIRTNIDFLINTSNKCPTISITSTISGEGKTFIAINLGGVIAITGKKVLLVDLDMRKPKISKSFEVENDKGVSTILSGMHSVDECIRQSSIESLHYITSGPIPPNPSELMMRSNFHDFVEKIKSSYDLVIFDTPPVGLVTDGRLVMKMVDLPIYVVRSEYSKRGFERNINELYFTHGFHNLSVILNNFKPLKGYGYGYKYGYNYQYGYYEDQKSMSIFKKIKTIFS